MFVHQGSETGNQSCQVASVQALAYHWPIALGPEPMPFSALMMFQLQGPRFRRRVWVATVSNPAINRSFLGTGCTTHF